MKRFALVALGICLAAAPLARADQWSKTYTITGTPDLRVETSDANIHVDTWDQKTIEARVTSEHYKIGEHGLKIEEHQSGDSVELQVHFPHDVHIITFNMHNYRVEVEIHMPRRTSQPAYRRRHNPAGKFQRGDGSANRGRPSGDRRSRRHVAGARRRRSHHCCGTIRRTPTDDRGRAHRGSGALRFDHCFKLDFAYRRRKRHAGIAWHFRRRRRSAYQRWAHYRRHSSIRRRAA
jgi:hypothetical protein